MLTKLPRAAGEPIGERNMITRLVRVLIASSLVSILAAAAGCCCPCGAIPNIPTVGGGVNVLPERAPIYRAAVDMAH